MKTRFVYKSGAILTTLFLLAFTLALSVAPVSANSGSTKAYQPISPNIIWSPSVNYNYVVAMGYPGRGSGSYSCLGQTWSSSSSVSGTKLTVTWSGPSSSYCSPGWFEPGGLYLWIRDNQGTTVYNGFETTASGSKTFTFLDSQTIVSVTVSWSYVIEIDCCTPAL
jgi:hypothetical protein